MNKLTRLTALLLAMMMIFSTIAAADTAYQVGDMTLDQWEDIVTKAEDELFVIDEGDSGKVVTPESPEQPPVGGDFYPYTDGTETELIISENSVTRQMTTSGVAVLKNSTAGQWQINIGGTWIGITGETGEALWVTAAMMNGMTTADFRKALEPVDEETGAYTAFTQTATVEIVAEAPAAFSLLARADENGDEDATPAEDNTTNGQLSLQAANDNNTWLVIVRYQFEDGTTAANPYSATLGVGTNFKDTIPNPQVMGYKPQETYLVSPVGIEGVTYTKPTVSTDQATLGDVLDPGSVNFDIANGSTDIIVTVTYVPTYVPYTVFHSQQNVSDDGYTQVESTTLRGLTGTKVGSEAVAKEYEGFFNLLYDQPEIAADGSTKVDIHYDRKYYLMNFDLSGGYGVEPIYARYGTPIGKTGVGDVEEPTRAGYSFRGWSLDGEKTMTNLPRTMPAEHLTYIALWNAGDAEYTVVYWRADVDDGDETTPTTYSYWTSKTKVQGKSGDSVVPSQVGADHPVSTSDLKDKSEVDYFAYDAAATAALNDDNKAITIAGDGSTVVNVYYSRKIYEIRFLYMYVGNDGNYRVYRTTGNGAVGVTPAGNIWTGNKQTISNIGKTLPTVTGYTSATEKVGNYTYHYISIKAEYGANIAKVWPAAAIGSFTYNGTEYSWGSWAAEQGTDYRVRYGDEHANIVGAYPVMSAEMIKNPNAADGVAQRMLAWWGSSADYNKPNIADHTYHIYLEALPEQTPNKTYEGKDYVLVESTVFKCAHNGTTRVDPFEYTGFVCVNDTRGTNNDRQSNSRNFANNTECPERTRCAYCNVFYYDRIEYPFTYTNYNEQSEPVNVKFGASLSTFDPGTPEYPADVAPGSLEFAGWYTTPECYAGTEVKWDGTMPAGPLNVYAKWVPTIHTVRFFLTPEKLAAEEIYEPQEFVDGMPVLYGTAMFQIEHNKNIAPEYVSSHLDRDAMIDADPRKPYTFAAWYYIDPDTNQKVYFNPGSPILRDMDLIAEWSSSVPVSYTIRYVTVVKDENGEAVEIEIAAPTTGSTLAGLDITFEAKGGEELNPGYQTGYFPTTKSHTINFKAEDALTGVEYTFEYTSEDEVEYTVYYVTETPKEGDTLDPIELDGKTYYIVNETKEEKTNQAIVTETFVTVPGYMPDAFQKRLVLVPDEENKIIFIYTVDNEHAYYQVTHNIQNLDGKTYTQYTASEVVGNIGTNATTEYQDDYMDIQGFTKERKEYIVGDRKPVAYSPDGVPLTADGMQINLYYTRNKYPYKVQYLLENSTQELADSETGEAFYQAEISEDAEPIANYELVNTTPQSLTIRIENGDEPVWNVITFYYREVSSTINYIPVGPDNMALTDEEKTIIGYVRPENETVGKLTGNASGSTATLLGAPTYKFVGWYDNQDCSGEPISTNTTFIPAQPGRVVQANGEVTYGVWVDGTTYYAKFEYNLTSMKIQKAGAVGPNETFIFTVEGYGLPEGGIKVMVAGNGSAIINGLTVGQKYTVTEDANWSWRYTAQSATSNALLPETDANAENNNTVTITNIQKHPYWLDGSDYEMNQFGEK